MEGYADGQREIRDSNAKRPHIDVEMSFDLKGLDKAIIPLKEACSK